MAEEKWHDVGSAEDLRTHTLTPVQAGTTPIALVQKDGAWSAISNVCNHVGGPLGEGHLDGDYVVCPWHHWKFHYRTGEGEPGFEADRVPSYAVKLENGRVLVDANARTPRHKSPHEPHPLARPVRREPGPVRVAGISTTVMDRSNPRYSGSEALLAHAVDHAQQALGAESRLIRLGELSFFACEGYYSKNAKACTWPCSITQMDAGDQLDRVYKALVHWADVILVATPIRWGAASSLYYKMAERMNCIQNQITTRDRVLIRDKVAGFIVIGGQDNVQAVAGQMLGFFAELGFLFPQFPYVAHSRGWAAEDMERNVEELRTSQELRQGAAALSERCPRWPRASWNPSTRSSASPGAAARRTPSRPRNRPYPSAVSDTGRESGPRRCSCDAASSRPSDAWPLPPLSLPTSPSQELLPAQPWVLAFPPRPRAHSPSRARTCLRACARGSPGCWTRCRLWAARRSRARPSASGPDSWSSIWERAAAYSSSSSWPTVRPTRACRAASSAGRRTCASTARPPPSSTATAGRACASVPAATASPAASPGRACPSR